MRRLISILISFLAINLYAAAQTPFAAPMNAPVAQMQSVNNATYMSSGSAYSSDIYRVNADAPMYAASPRKAPPDKDPGGYDPNNPQFSPVGEGLIPLLIMLMAYATCIFLRRKTSRV